MKREIPRTLLSLTRKYQDIGNWFLDYEVLVIDNGSLLPAGDECCKVQKGFTYHFLPNAATSPAAALNLGARLARGSVLGFLVDGARLVTPGVLRHVESAFLAFQNPIVTIPGWHLGPKPQQLSVLEGYNQLLEDRLLDSIDWPREGYKLFKISVPSASWIKGCFIDLSESNAVFLARGTFEAIGGFDERFNFPGGGLLNLDFYYRAATSPNTQVVVLPGEGTFHQVHGGISTNVSQEENLRLWHDWEAQYQLLVGHKYKPAQVNPVIFGRIPPQALPYLSFSANHAYKLFMAAERERTMRFM